ncbi:DUF4123 domain-containing protein [Yersinia rochesterensis]|uniref:DUF4123 domain-containing protein n=1 Tax=Yersinia rochesterensis TaxID=1604335 RepID=UPI001F48EBC0|nr:DUF4123 domain-containing protein [Yersinia rochesterensis]
MEGGAQSPEEFQAFYAAYSSDLYSLFLHPQLTDARNYGPWLFAVDDREKLPKYMADTPGIAGVIISSCYPGSLAAQLSYGCTMIRPDNTTALIRFYTRHVISLLAQCDEQEWHTFLFQDIVQWWAPSEEAWRQITIKPSKVENARNRTLKLDEEIWQQIADKPAISTVLTQWQKMPSSQHFPPCAQRDMVIKALDKAQIAGMADGVDSKLYALYYLNGGKKVLESEEMQISLRNVSEGKVSLVQILTHHAAR